MEPRAAHSSRRRVAVASSPLAAARRFALAGGLVLLASLGSLVLPAGVRADTPPAPAAAASGRSPEDIEREAEAIARSIMSPFCPGRTVSACPAAGPWRDDIRKMVAQGIPPDEVKRLLAERVPNHNLSGVPKNRLGWALPVGLGVIAIGILVFLLRYLVGPRAGSTDEKPAGDAAKDGSTRAEPDAVASRGKPEDYDERLKQELETLEQ